MGNKVNPKSIRLGITKTWNSKWFSETSFIEFLRQDVLVRKFFMGKLREAGVSSVDIERAPGKLTINAHVAKPGIVIGKSGSGVEALKDEVTKKILNKAFSSVPGKLKVSLNILEVDNPNLHAQIVVDQIIMELEKRMAFRRIMKTAIQRVMKSGALGVKVGISGRLNGGEIARREALAEGRLPLHTLRADIDYSRGHAMMTYGKIGVKVWIYKGEVFDKSGKPIAPVAPKREGRDQRDRGAHRPAAAAAKKTA